MKEIQLLIVEDDSAQIQTYEDNITSINKRNTKHKFVATICKDFKSGCLALNDPYYDAAIIDLKLSADSVGLEGAELVQDMNGNLRIPIYIVSGSISQIDHIGENILLQKRLRTERFSTILEEIERIYETGITTLLKKSGFIDGMLTDIFWKHLSESLFDLDGPDSPKALMRYIAAHIQEFLEVDNDGGLENLHLAEFYIIPPIKMNLSTGDIIRNETDGSLSLLLTPACDVILRTREGQSKYRNAEYALLIKLIVWNSIETFNSVTIATGANNSTRKKLEAYIKNNKERFHFCPPYKFLQGYFVDFQSQTSLRFSELEGDNYKRIATVSQSFLKDIIARYSQYYSRQGQPDLRQDTLFSSLVTQNT